MSTCFWGTPACSQGRERRKKAFRKLRNWAGECLQRSMEQRAGNRAACPPSQPPTSTGVVLSRCALLCLAPDDHNREFRLIKLIGTQKRDKSVQD